MELLPLRQKPDAPPDEIRTIRNEALQIRLRRSVAAALPHPQHGRHALANNRHTLV